MNNTKEQIDKYLSESQNFINLGDYLQAKETLYKAYTLDSNNPDTLYAMGMIEYLTKNYDHSINFLEKVLNENRLRGKAANLLGFSYLKKKDYQKPEQFFKIALEDSPDDIDPLVGLAALELYRQNYLEAEKLYLEILNKKPDHLGSYNNLALVYQNKFEFEKAKKIYEQLLSIKITPEALCNLATIYHKTNEYDTAIELCKTTIKHFPRNAPLAYSHLGKMLAEKNFLNEAEAVFIQGIKHTNSSTVYYSYGVFLQEEKFDFIKAGEFYKKALGLNPNDVDSYFGLAVYYHKGIGDLEKAIQACKKGIEIDPYNIKVMGYLANIYYLRNEKEKAKKVIFDGLEKFKNIQDTYFLNTLESVSNTPEEINRTINLIENCTRYIKNSETSDLFFYLGRLYEKKQDFSTAFQNFSLGNDIKKENVKIGFEMFEEYISVLKQIFRKETIKKFMQFGNQDDMPIFIIGMPRSGTSLVEQILDSHTQVFGCGELATIEQITRSIISEGLNEQKISLSSQHYLSYIKNRFGIESKRSTDKMPQNFIFLGLINMLFPKAKVIHIKRNPYATSFSIFQSNFRSDGHFYSFNLDDIGKYYNYYEHIMEYWKNNLDMPIYELSYEDLIDNFETNVKNLLKYCELPFENNCLDFHKNKRVVVTSSVDQIRKPLYNSSVDKWENYKNDLKPLDKYFKD